MTKTKAEQKGLKRELQFGLGSRLTHWIRAIAIVVLIVTGFYIAYVFIAPEVTNTPTNFLNAKFRAVHQIAGFILIACFLVKVYLFFFNTLSSKERISFKDALSLKRWKAQLKYYLFLGEHPKEQRGLYNPLQFVTYTFFYLLLFELIVTGLVLYAHVYHSGLGGFIHAPARWVEMQLGGLANVRLFHHVGMWCVIIFVVLHIYMAVFNAIKDRNGGVDGMVSGYKFVE